MLTSTESTSKCDRVPFVEWSGELDVYKRQGYGSFNNYLYCEEHGMGKYMKFTMYEKENKNIKYHNDPYRAVNFRIDENGDLVCPNNKKFHYVYSRPIKGNKYGRTEESVSYTHLDVYKRQIKLGKL